MQQLFNCNEVFQTFRHLKAFDMKMADVNEVTYPVWLVIKCLRLSQLILMMREDEIDST